MPLPQCVCVLQSYSIVFDSGTGLLDSSLNGIIQAGILEWVYFPFPVFPTQDQTHIFTISALVGRVFTIESQTSFLCFKIFIKKFT